MAVSTYLAERYWPDVSAAALEDALARMTRELIAMQREGKEIDYVRTTLVPDQETVLSVFEAESSILVDELNDRTAFGYDRIVEALAVGTERT